MCCLFGMADYGHHFNGRQKSRMLSILAICAFINGPCPLISSISLSPTMQG